jgi:hypothetical protein
MAAVWGSAHVWAVHCGMLYSETRVYSGYRVRPDLINMQSPIMERKLQRSAKQVLTMFLSNIWLNEIKVFNQNTILLHMY